MASAIPRSETTETVSRFPRERPDKFAERRTELAQAALLTLSELGYARTSLREIAQNSTFSHGVLHYYFKDKLDLITCCVGHYKQQCVARYDRVTADAMTFQALLDGFTDALAASIREEAHLHRLWYDIRAQAMFEPHFRADVAAIDQGLQDMIWRIVARLHELRNVSPNFSPPLVYALVDGVFQHCLIKHNSGDIAAIEVMDFQVRSLVEQLMKKT